MLVLCALFAISGRFLNNHGSPMRRSRRAPQAASKEECELACEEVQDEGFKHACKFDCVVTGDIQVSSNPLTSWSHTQPDIFRNTLIIKQLCGDIID